MCDLDATLRALSHATPEQLEEISQTALQLGKETAFVAREASAGLADPDEDDDD